MASQIMTLTAADQHSFSAYQIIPEGVPQGCIVVLQEIYGVNQAIKEIAGQFAKAGYTVIVPALFDRQVPGIALEYNDAGFIQGRKLYDQFDYQTAMLDINACLIAGKKWGKVTLVGYCFGGSLAWLAASQLNRLAAAVCYYGKDIVSDRDMKPLCPVQMHFGEQDPMIPIDNVALIRKSHPKIPIYTYPAGHGFANPLRTEFDATSAELAIQRTLAFIKNI